MVSSNQLKNITFDCGVSLLRFLIYTQRIDGDVGIKRLLRVVNEKEFVAGH